MRKETICNLKRNKDTGEYKAVMLSAKLEDKDLLEGKINVIIQYDVVDDQCLKSVISVDKNDALGYYHTFKPRFHKDQFIEIVSTLITPGFPPLEVVMFDNSKSLLVLE